MTRIFAALTLSCGLLVAPMSPAMAQSSKQVSQTVVGPWSVLGWVAPDGAKYCSAERDVGEVRAAFVRFTHGYALLLRSPSWFLDAGGNYPFQYAAATTTGTVRAQVLGSNMVLAQLSSDVEVMRRIAAAGVIEVTVANSTVKVPLEQFAEALAALDNCLNNATPPQQPSPNPVTAPQPPAVQPRANPPSTTPATYPTQKMPLEQQTSGPRAPRVAAPSAPQAPAAPKTELN